MKYFTKTSAILNGSRLKKILSGPMPKSPDKLKAAIKLEKKKKALEVVERNKNTHTLPHLRDNSKKI